MKAEEEEGGVEEYLREQEEQEEEEQQQQQQQTKASEGEDEETCYWSYQYTRFTDDSSTNTIEKEYRIEKWHTEKISIVFKNI